MSSQRYVSNELTHFIGRGKEQLEQYDLLVNHILKPGWLTYPPHDRRSQRSPSADLSKTISDGQMLAHQIVCFCDIPLADLELHMKKYSKFGIAFRRDFLFSFGANPVFYVANNSTVQENTLIPVDHLLDRMKKAITAGKIDRGLYFDNYLKVLLDLLWILNALAHDYQAVWLTTSRSRDQNRAAAINMLTSLFALSEAEIDQMAAVASSRVACGITIKNISEFLLVGLVDFIKCFDATKAEDDPDNYYMEREWRVPQNIQFTLADVERVIIPRYFAEAFRTDLPQYMGQIHFAE
jgi:hypothetical protein